MQIRIAGVEMESIVDGPGYRLAVFAQGCPHGCPGCHNPQTHDMAGGRMADTQEIIALLGKNPLVRGVTLTGGGPRRPRGMRDGAGWPPPAGGGGGSRSRLPRLRGRRRKRG